MTNHTHHSSPPTPRRGFLGRLVAAVAGVAGLTVAGVAPGRLLAAGAGGTAGDTHPGDEWMRELKGKHRTVFDMSAHRNGKPLAQAKNFLDAWRDAFATPERDVNLVIGIHGEAIPVVLNDALWARFKLGEQYEVMDATSKTAAVRNAFSAANASASGLLTAEQSVESLQKRGVRFLVCMNTIAGATRKLSAAGFGSPDEVRAAIMGGLLPGVITVPAMVVALTQLQERGVRYVKIA